MISIRITDIDAISPKLNAIEVDPIDARISPKTNAVGPPLSRPAPSDTNSFPGGENRETKGNGRFQGNISLLMVGWKS